jgi:hypothetical protein
VWELLVDGFDDVEDLIRAQVCTSVLAEERVRRLTQRGFEILVGSGVKVEPEPPRGYEARAC